MRTLTQALTLTSIATAVRPVVAPPTTPILTLGGATLTLGGATLTLG